MKKLLTYSLIIVLLMPLSFVRAADSLEAGMSELAQQIVVQSKAKDKHSIAVAAFPLGDGSLAVLSNYIVDELVLSLFSVPNSNLQIVERSQLETILGELNLGQSGMIDIETTKELGKMHGVDALIIGSITTIGDIVRVIARMISTETGQVFSAASTTIPKTNTIEALMNQRITISPPPSSKQASATAPQAMSSSRVSPKQERVADLGILQAEVERIQPVEERSFMFYLNFTNKTDKDIWLIPGHPQQEKIVASDELGNIYNLTKTTGMQRNREYGSSQLGYNGIYLMAPPKVPTRASFLLSLPMKEDEKEEVKRGTLISLSAEFLIVTDFKTGKYFNTTATFIDLTP